MTLQLVPGGWASRRFALVRDGRPLARLHLRMLREGGTIDVQGERYELRRQGVLSSAFELHRFGVLVARARKTSAVRHRFGVEHDGRFYELRKATWWGRAFQLREHGRPVGHIRPLHPFTRRSDVYLPDSLSVPAQVFVSALAVLMWRRDAGAAAGGGS